MKKMSALIGAVGIAVCALNSGGSAAASRVSATVEFRDSAGDRIGSDGYADPAPPSADAVDYQDAVDCVIAYVQGNMFFMRTVNVTCPVPNPRSITLDFSDFIGDTLPPGADCTDGVHEVDDSYGQAGPLLNICGSNNVADVRLSSSSLFSNTALSNGAGVWLAFNLAPDFHNTAFSLAFEQNVAVEGDSTTRTMTAGSSAIAELYKSEKVGKKTVSVSQGRFYMPFSATVTKQ
jgi:hypothetical protein